MPIDLDEIAARVEAAVEESGAWDVFPDGPAGIWIEVLGDPPNPGRAAAAFIRDSRDTTLALVAELRAAYQQIEEYEHLRSTLVTRFNLGSALRPALVADWVIHAYDKAVG